MFQKKPAKNSCDNAGSSDSSDYSMEGLKNTDFDEFCVDSKASKSSLPMGSVSSPIIKRDSRIILSGRANK